MDDIDRIQNQFGNTKAIFKGRLVDDDTSLRFTALNPYNPSTENINDPLELLMISRYSEGFNANKRRYEKHDLRQTVHYAIIAHLQKRFLELSPLSSPRKAKTYKWLDEMERMYNHPSQEGFIALYRYSKSLESSQNHGKNDPHAKNFLAILEKMRDYYEN